MAPPSRLQQQQQNSETDVVTAARSSDEAKVMEKFSDVYKVRDECSDFGFNDIDNVSDDFSVAGRLSNPKYISFFESIGSSSYVLNTLRDGHKPHLTSEVPDFE